MSQILIQKEQVGAPKLSQIIREFTFPQLRDTLTDHKGGYCVYGGLLHYFGYDWATSNSSLTAYREIIKLCHNDYWKNETLHDIISMNNTGSTFSEIADYLESRGL